MSKFRGSDNNKKSGSKNPYHRLAQSLDLGNNGQRTSTHPDFKDFRGPIYDLKGGILHPALPYQPQSARGTAHQTSTNPNAKPLGTAASSNVCQSSSISRESPRLSLEESLKRRLSRTSFDADKIDRPDESSSVGGMGNRESKKRMEEIALRLKAKRLKHNQFDSNNYTGIRVKMEPESDESLLKDPTPTSSAPIVGVHRNSTTQPPPTKPTFNTVRGAKPAKSIPTPISQSLPVSQPSAPDSRSSTSRIAQKARGTRLSNDAQAPRKIEAAKSGNMPAPVSNGVQATTTRQHGELPITPASASKTKTGAIGRGYGSPDTPTRPPVKTRRLLDGSSTVDSSPLDKSKDDLATNPRGPSGAFKKAQLQPRSPKRTFTVEDIDRPDKSIDWYNLRDQDYTKLHQEVELDLYPLTKGYKAFTPVKYKYSNSELEGVQERFLDVHGYCTGDDYTRLVYRLNECRKAQLLLEISSYQELLDVKDRLKATRAGLEKALSQC